MRHRLTITLAGCTLIATALVAAPADPPATQAVADRATLEKELRATETAFAKTMADRDHAAFAGFIADEAVFFGRAGGEIRGKAAVVEAWAGLFTGKEPPFSWRPEVAVVLESRALGFTSGPVFDPKGKQTGTFNSVWRRESDSWKIVFDKGCPPCGSP